MIVCPGEANIIIPFAPVDSTGAPVTLAHDTAGLVAEYKAKHQDAWTQITPLVAGTLGTWADKSIVSDGNGYTELSLPAGISSPPTFEDSIQHFVVVRLRLAGMICPPVRIDYRGIPYQSAGTIGGIPKVVFSFGGDGHIVSHPVTIKTSQYNALTTLLNAIKAKVALIGTIFTSFVGRNTQTMQLTQGDDYDDDTGQYLGFSFKGVPDITDCLVVVELWYKNGELIDSVSGVVVTASADPTETQEIRGLASNIESSLWPPSDISKDMEALGRVIFPSGSVRTVGRAKLDVLRG